MITAETVTTELDAFNQSLAEYMRHTSKTTEQALAAKGNDFAWALSNRLKGLKPGKGTIRQERIAAMKRGEGVLIRKGLKEKMLSLKGFNLVDGNVRFGKRLTATKNLKRDGVKKKLNFHALLVERELNLREKASGFLAHVARMQNRGAYSIKKLSANETLRHIGDVNQIIGKAGLKIDPQPAKLTITFGDPIQTTAGEGIAKPQQFAMVAEALREVRKDMAVYIQRKQVEQLRRDINKAVK